MVAVRCDGVPEEGTHGAAAFVLREVVPLSVDLLPADEHHAAGAVRGRIQVVDVSIGIGHPAGQHPAVRSELEPAVALLASALVGVRIIDTYPAIRHRAGAGLVAPAAIRILDPASAGFHPGREAGRIELGGPVRRGLSAGGSRATAMTAASLAATADMDRDLILQHQLRAVDLDRTAAVSDGGHRTILVHGRHATVGAPVAKIRTQRAPRCTLNLQRLLRLRREVQAFRAVLDLEHDRLRAVEVAVRRRDTRTVLHGHELQADPSEAVPVLRLRCEAKCILHGSAGSQCTEANASDGTLSLCTIEYIGHDFAR